MIENDWNKLSGIYDTRKDDPSAIDPNAADNILIAWPVLLSAAKTVQPNSDGLRALDFGCGTGGFCAKLQSIGYDVVGCDGAENMVWLAQKNLGNHIPLYVGDQSIFPDLKEKPFDLVSAIMVFQFIEDIEKTFHSIGGILNPRGVLAFASFNPDYVRSNHGEGKSFQGMIEPHAPQEAFFCPIGGIRIPVFIRDEAAFDEILLPLGYRRIVSSRPPFTPEFLQRYPAQDVDRRHPEFIVMAYQKLSL